MESRHLGGGGASRPRRAVWGGPRSRAAVKCLVAAALLVAFACGGYYGWTNHVQKLKEQQAKERARIEAEREKREKELAEERTRIEKAAQKRIARLEAEKEKAEAERRRIEAEREKREKELAEERARLEKARKRK